jgi:hypothetical protein
MRAIQLNPEMVKKIESKIARKRESALLNILGLLFAGVSFGALFWWLL